LIFGEVAPKNVAVHIPEKVLLALAGPTKFVMTILYPLAFIVQKLAGLVARLFGIDVSKDIETYTEEELKTMVDLSHAGGLIEEEEKEMIHNVFELDERTAKDVMVPRVDMTAIGLDATYEDVNEIFKKEQFTRIPVYDESIDNIVGILNVKDLLLLEESERKNFAVKNIIRKAVYIYEKKKALEILATLKEERANIAIVLDEYGVTAGMVTLEDVIEEIVGDIRDEYDVPEDEEIKKVSDTEYIIEGSASIVDINDATGLALSAEEGVESIGGIVLSNSEDIPKRGQMLLFENYKIQVLEMDGNRISKVKLTIIDAGKDADSDQ
jgi:CBS domain containing-hemolysin-like protein